MSTSGHHAAALAAAAATYGTTPVAASTLPRIATRHLDAARVQLGAELDRLDNEQREIDRSLEHARQVIADAHQAAARSDAVIAEAEERHRRLGEAARSAGERMSELTARSLSIAAELDEAERAGGAHDGLVDLVDRLAERIGAGSLTPEEIHTLADDLDRGSVATVEAGVAGPHDAVADSNDGVGAAPRPAGDGLGEACAAWAAQLRDGTAPLRPESAAALAELTALEQEWDDLGRGDLFSVPAVGELQAALDDARHVRADIEAQASAGVLGPRAMEAIRTANARRNELETSGTKFDVEALAEAVRAETEALHLVGFDSMLDFHIATSTGGTGTLVEARREAAARRVEELETELAALLGATVAAQADVSARADALRARVEQLAGPLGDRALDEVLRGLLVVPESIDAPRRAADEGRRASVELIDAHRQEQAAIATEMSALDLRRAVALAGASEAAADIERAVHTREAALSAATSAQHATTELERRAQDARAALTASAQLSDALASQRYAEEDRRELSNELVTMLYSYATWLEGARATPEWAHCSALVVDDPLDELDEADAVRVIDDLAALDWPVPLVYVTSRPRLVQRFRRETGDVRGIDGRRGGADPVPTRWRRRRRADEAVRG